VDDRVVIVDYDPAWPRRFAAERDRLLELFEPDVARIEHIGSTAVLGLAAKPIVDMLLGVARLAEVERRIPALVERGWEYVAKHESVFPDRRFLARPQPRPRSHHLHAVEVGSDFWEKHLLFRDHLRAHPEDVAAYVALKRRLARRYRNDRAAYTEAKSDFIEGVLARCRG